MKLCKYPGCNTPIDDYETYCEKHGCFGIQEQLRKDEVRRKRDRDKLYKMNKDPRYGSNRELRYDNRFRKIKKQLLETYPRCQICGSTHNLQVHHIVQPKGDESLFFDLNNLLVVCEECHKHLSNIQKRKRG